MSVDNHHTSNAATHKQCDHGNCLNHNPKWERVGEPYTQSNPSSYLKRTIFLDRWVHRHCGMAMQRVSRHAVQQCKLCGRKEEFLIDELAALCRCCGYHYGIIRTFCVLFSKKEKNKKLN